MNLRFLWLAIALLGFAFFASPAGAAWPGRNGPVVYIGLEPAPPGVAAPYVAAGLRTFAPGAQGAVMQLTEDHTDRDPKVSPDGRRVVFSRTVSSSFEGSTSGIFVVDIDGTGLTRVTSGGPGGASDSEPTFYPSGRRIAFVRGSSEPEGRPALYSVRLDGTGLRRVFAGATEIGAPAVSPSGRQIAFACRYVRDGFEINGEHICSVRPDGSRRRALTRRFDGQVAFDPDFSPSGRTIAFDVGPGIAADVFTMRANGARLGALTNRGPRGGRTFPRDLGYDDPAFAPAGGRLIAVARTGVRPRFVIVPLRDGAPPPPRRLDPRPCPGLGAIAAGPLSCPAGQAAAWPSGLTTNQRPPNSSTSWQRIVPGESST